MQVLVQMNLLAFLSVDKHLSFKKINFNTEIYQGIIDSTGTETFAKGPKLAVAVAKVDALVAQ